MNSPLTIMAIVVLMTCASVVVALTIITEGAGISHVTAGIRVNICHDVDGAPQPVPCTEK